MRAKCIYERNKDGVKDPELSVNKFYEVIESNIQVMGENADGFFVSLVGDSGIEIQRPKKLFYFFC